MAPDDAARDQDVLDGGRRQVRRVDRCDGAAVVEDLPQLVPAARAEVRALVVGEQGDPVVTQGWSPPRRPTAPPP
ncbi:hypothetical protein [Streptomyces sp. NPDC001492]